MIDFSENELRRQLAEISNAMYAASTRFEELEADGKIIGNGHHIRQHLSEVAQWMLLARWKNTDVVHQYLNANGGALSLSPLGYKLWSEYKHTGKIPQL